MGTMAPAGNAKSRTGITPDARLLVSQFRRYGDKHAPAKLNNLETIWQVCMSAKVKLRNTQKEQITSSSPL
jgi:hypothetical protein